MTAAILFGLFAATLFGVARFHHHALWIALGGLVAALTARSALTEFAPLAHFAHEGHILGNLAGLLLGFAVLASHFERSHLPERLAHVLPTGRAGAFVLLVLVALMSAVLDNIAAALIGGTTAKAVFRGRVHLGYLAALVAASNAGGAGSVIGDTTTTMLWIEGAAPLWLATASLGSAVAVLFLATFASSQQQSLQPLERPAEPAPHVDVGHLTVVALTIGGAIAANVLLDAPAVGVWGALLLGALVRGLDVAAVRHAMPGALFLLALVSTASLMPVEQLPSPTAGSTLGLGFVSAVFDNIPLTKLAIDQGGYDWGLLAYAVGYGGSMLWFGSSAGVAIAGVFAEAKSARAWLQQGWHVSVGYVLGFAAMFLILGWNVQVLRRDHTPVSHPPGHHAR